MRRYLGPGLTFAATAYLALGCQNVSAVNSTAGVVGVGPVLGAGAGGGMTTSASSGGGGGVSMTSDVTAPQKADPLEFSACLATAAHAAPVFLSAPHARATVSATQVRGILLGGSTDMAAPQPSNIRGGELLSYYHIDYPVAPSDDFTVVAELVATGAPQQFLLQVGVQAPRVMLTKSKEQRRQTSLTVVVDTSTSMDGEPMARANAAVAALASSLNTGDILNLVTTNAEAPLVHRIAASTGDPALFPLTSLFHVVGGGTIQTAIDRAYKAANDVNSLFPAGINRVVVVTDGGGLASDIAPDQIVAGWNNNRIQLVGVGVGSAPTYRNDVLGAATAEGHGANLYLDSVKEAVPALHDRFDEVMDEAAGEVTIGVAVPSLMEMVNVDDSGAVVSEGQLLRSDLGRRRSMVFRHLVKMCSSPDPTTSVLLDQTLEITTSWNDPGSGKRLSRVDKLTIGSAMPTAESYQMRKVTAILAFGSAIQSLTPSRFQVACVGLAHARTALSSAGQGSPSDPELDSLKAQLEAHPLMGGNKCP